MQPPRGTADVASARRQESSRSLRVDLGASYLSSKWESPSGSSSYSTSPMSQQRYVFAMRVAGPRADLCERCSTWQGCMCCPVGIKSSWRSLPSCCECQHPTSGHLILIKAQTSGPLPGNGEHGRVSRNGDTVERCEWRRHRDLLWRSWPEQDAKAKQTQLRLFSASVSDSCPTRRNIVTDVVPRRPSSRRWI